MSVDWNYADVWETVAQAAPRHVAQIHGDRQLDWAEFDARANGIAAALLKAGFSRQDMVALYLYNSPAFMQANADCRYSGLL